MLTRWLGTGLGATWNTELIQKGGALQGEEAIVKGAHVILGPTVNMQRGPLGGRGFESFSEDPVLAGNMGAATIKGIQSTGVAATIKHYVCNDLEDQRMSVDSIVTERALREIYLMPFQIAQRDSDPMAYMTGYNLVNGTHCAESPKLLQDILREEWGFDGLVMSDWYGTYSTTESIKAGLDLEMPGPTRIRGELINQALGCGKLLPHHLDKRVRELLKLIKKVLPLGIPEDAEEKTRDIPETAALLREIGAESLVLMKNEGNVLPFKPEKTTAVIGPNAAIAAYCGGGSAALLPYYAVSPLEGVRRQAGDVKYELGSPGWKRLPFLSHKTKTKDGKRGLDMTVYLEPPTTKDRKPIDKLPVDTSRIILNDYKHPKLTSDLFHADFDGTFTPEETAEYEFSCSVAGTAKIFIDGELLVDNATKQTPGDSFFGTGTREESSSIKLEKDRAYKVHVEFATLAAMTFKVPGVTAFGYGGVRIGCERKIVMKDEIARAVAVAKQVDQVVLCAGLNSDWESEGYDRSHMDLPPGSDDLIQAVVAANPNTTVVIQAGTPVTMPWLKEVPSLVYAWYGGNETGNAIADVVFGKANPSGKLSLSFPRRNEDNPAFLNFKSEHNRVLYGEDVYMGYRFYEMTKKEVAFPFGHGLSYTTFDISSLTVDTGDDEIAVTAKVTNTGSTDGAQVVQVYVAEQAPSIDRPPKELKGFTKVSVKAGQSVTATVKISKKYATSHWDEGREEWVSTKGKYTVLVGDSSANTPLSAEFEVDKTVWWKGL